MTLKIRDIMDFMEEVAPSILKESYDNVGLQVGDSEEALKGIVIALDCTLEVIEEAKRNKANLIFTHHPLLFKKPSTITRDTLQGKKIIELIKNNINLYSSHTNLDSVKGGLNDILVELLGFENSIIIEENKFSSHLKNSGIGRIVEVNEGISVLDLCNDIKDKLNLDFLRVVSKEEKLIKRIAIINGSGESYFELSRKMGVDCIITGDTTYHYVSDYREMGITIIDIGHFSSEWIIFKAFSKKIKKYLENNSHEVPIYISQTNREPYKVI